jgi:hypothetical protein
MQMSTLRHIRSGLAATLALGLVGTASEGQASPTPPAYCESLDGAGFGAAGLQACNAALASLESGPAQDSRRFALLQSRALHRLATGDPAGATADLDAAASAALSLPPALKRGLEPGLMLARALAARLGGDTPRCETLAMQAFTARPFSRPFATAALTAMGPAARIESIEPVLRRLAQLDPATAADLHRALFEQGRSEQALSVFPALTAMDIIRPEVMGRHAYSLAVLGRSGEAAEALKQMQGYLSAPSPEAQQWSRLTESRLLLNDKRFEDAVARLDAASASLPASYASVELIEAFADQAPPGDRPDTKTFHAALERARREAATVSVQRLAVALRQAEGNAGGAAAIIAAPETRLADGSLVISVQGPGLAEVEEAALLRAAQAARRTGADAFVITSRRDIQKNAAAGGGFESILTVRPTSAGSADIPAMTAWRLMYVEPVHATLEPAYGAGG